MTVPSWYSIDFNWDRNKLHFDLSNKIHPFSAIILIWAPREDLFKNTILLHVDLRFHPHIWPPFRSPGIVYIWNAKLVIIVPADVLVPNGVRP